LGQVGLTKNLYKDWVKGSKQNANKAISLYRCRIVILRDFTIIHGGWFAILATGVDNLTIDNLKIDTNRDGIELRMFEMKLKQKDLALLLETSTSRISEYLNGKRDITIEIARALHKKLNIDSDIILQG
jgi:hypothetical protein